METGLFALLNSTELTAYIGQRVKARRKFLKLSRKELSARCGVSIATLNRLEKDGTATIHVLVKVAIALKSIDTFEDLFKNPPARSLDEYNRQREAAK